MYKYIILPLFLFVACSDKAEEDSGSDSAEEADSAEETDSGEAEDSDA